MGHALLWIELLAAKLLLVAFLLACLGRLKRRGLRVGLGVLLYLWLLVPPIALSITLGYWEFGTILTNLLFYHTAALTLCYVVGAIWLWVRGLRRTGDSQTPTVAAAWPRLKLLAAWGAMTVVLLGTFFTLDAIVRHRMVKLRTQATELSRSLGPAPLPESENALLDYQQANALLGSEEEWEALPAIWQDAYEASKNEGYLPERYQWNEEGEFVELPEGPFDFSDPALGDFLAQHEAALLLARRGAAKPEMYIDVDFSDLDEYLELDVLSSVRKLVQLLGVDARYRAACGDGAGAIKDLTAMLSISQQAGQQPTMLWGLVAMGFQFEAMQTARAILAMAPIEEEALNQAAAARRPNCRNVMTLAIQGEEAFVLSVLAGDTFEEGRLNETEFARLLDGSVYRVLFQARDVKICRASFQHTLDYFHSQTNPGEKAIDDFYNSQSVSLKTYTLLPPVNANITIACRGDAFYAAFDMALALYRYQARHKKLPNSLEELVPEFLPAIPTDPYDGQPVRVQRGEEQWVAYCLGPNGVDDGGVPFETENMEGDIAFEVVKWDFTEENATNAAP